MVIQRRGGNLLEIRLGRKSLFFRLFLLLFRSSKNKEDFVGNVLASSDAFAQVEVETTSTVQCCSGVTQSQKLSHAHQRTRTCVRSRICCRCSISCYLLSLVAPYSGIGLNQQLTQPPTRNYLLPTLANGYRVQVVHAKGERTGEREGGCSSRASGEESFVCCGVRLLVPLFSLSFSRHFSVLNFFSVDVRRGTSLTLKNKPDNSKPLRWPVHKKTHCRIP